MPTEKPRFSITVSEEMFREIEDFRFENRYNNRNDAIMELIRLGFEALKKQQSSGEINIDAEVKAYRKELEDEKSTKTSLASQDSSETCSEKNKNTARR